MLRFLSLTNFKCFPYLELEFAPLTLITGANGAGKSTVIQSLLLLRQSYDWRYLQEEKVSVDGELVNLVSGSAIRYFWEEKDPLVGIQLEFEDDVNGNWQINSSDRGTVLSTKIEENQRSVFGQNLFNDNFAYLHAERPGPRAGSGSTDIKLRHPGRLGTKFGEKSTSFLYDLRMYERRLQIPRLRFPGCDSDAIYQNVDAWLSYIFGNAIELRPKQNSPVDFELELLVTQPGKKPMLVSPLNSAFGYSYLFPIVLGVLTAEPGSLFIVENPEAHLHPSAQTRIGKLLALAAQNGVQVVVETHSDHLINGVRVLVKGEPDGNKIDSDVPLIHYFNSVQDAEGHHRYRQTMKIQENGEMDDWPNGFFDEWENNLIKLIS